MVSKRTTDQQTDTLLRGAVGWQKRPADTAVAAGKAAADFLDARQRQWAKQIAVVDAWQAIAPPGLKDRCQLLDFRGRTLVIAAPPGPYRHQLEIVKTELVKQLQRLCPKAGVSRIEIITLTRQTQDEPNA